MAASAIGGIAAGAVSGVFGGKGAKKAAATQAAATRDAAAMADPFRTQRGYYQDILRGLYGGMAPVGAAGEQIYRAQPVSFGGKTNGMFHRLMGPQLRNAAAQRDARTPTTSGVLEWMAANPAYQFTRGEAMRETERAMAARGFNMSGNLLASLQQRAGGLASQQYSSEVNRLMTLAGATAGSPGVAGQITAQGGAQQAAWGQQAMGSYGYGLGQIAQAVPWGNIFQSQPSTQPFMSGWGAYNPMASGGGSMATMGGSWT